MTHWWEIGTPDPNAVPKFRAVAYYRHSAQDRQENSIPIQQEQVRDWAEKNGVEIIHEFADADTVILAIDDSGEWQEFSISDLLPASFHLS